MELQFGKLTFKSAINQPNVTAAPVNDLLANWKGTAPVEEILSAEIDPEFSDSLAFCEKYEIKPEEGANCLIVKSKREGKVTYAACLVPIDKRADVNGIVRKQLNGAQISFAPREEAVELSGMEFGSITVVGLPKDWPILVDESLINIPWLILGGGLRKSKLLVPGKILAELPNAKIINLSKNNIP